jgi:predicted Zn-dependent peptidase
MKNTYFLVLLLFFSFTLSAQQFTPLQSPPKLKVLQNLNFNVNYDSVPGDPLKTRIYTLNNGLKVFISVVKDQPKIQGYVVIKAGSKNDPPYATGLAHYLEHMLFKGTTNFGTLNYEKEKPLLQKIEDLYEVYRKTSDIKERKKIYHEIDSVSGIAAQYAIANEYDKMIAAIGGEKSNAYTWFDQTVYFEQFPSNQLFNWLRLQSDRFRNPVMRIFHTELEAVYEEKNMSLDDDNDKLMDELFANLFKNHTYGTQTTIGTIEHLKNPSIVEIRNFFKKYYVPNNMGLVLVGDLNPDEAIKQVAISFGSMVKSEVTDLKFEPESEITKPIEKNVIGPESESVTLAYRFGGANTIDAVFLQLAGELLYNGNAGLLDENIKTAQTALSASAYPFILNDYSMFAIDGQNKEGQKLETVKDLLLKELSKLADGNFSDEQFNAAKTNLKLKYEKQYDNIESRGSLYVDALVKKQDWKTYFNNIQKLQSVNKNDFILFCKNGFKNNYVVVYKRMGEDPNVVKVEKPEITPVEVNRDAKSEFFKNLETTPVSPISPKFVDFNKVIAKQKTKNNQEYWFVKNTSNTLFKFYLGFPFGKLDEPLLDLSIKYLMLAGDQNNSAALLKKQMYQLGCNWNPIIQNHNFLIEISGLSENYEKAISLVYTWLKQTASKPDIFSNLINDYQKELDNQYTDKRFLLWNGLLNYSLYGKEYASKIFLSKEKVGLLKIEDLLSVINKCFNTPATLMFYGNTDPMSPLNRLNGNFGKNELKPYIPSIHIQPQAINSPKVYFLNYEMTQADLLWASTLSNFNPDFYANGTLYNEYFGGGMAAIVFQTLRESKALAYSARSVIQFPERIEDSFLNIAYIGTQADKLKEASAGMQDLLKTMPTAQPTFDVTKKVQMQKIISSPIVKEQLLLQHYAWNKLGINNDFHQLQYNILNNASLNALSDFQLKHIQPLNYNLMVVGDKNKINFKSLESFGSITELNISDVFGK